MKFEMVESFKDTNWILRDYRKLASLDESIEITKENLDNDIIAKIAGRNYLEKEQVIEALLGQKEPITSNEVVTEDIKSDVIEEQLTEDTIGDAAEKELADKVDAEIVDDSDDVKKELDRALATARRLQRRGKTDGFVNILLTGEAGVGKTARCKQWAKERGINLYIRKAMDLDTTDMGGAITPDKEGKKVNRLTSSEWDPLDRPNSVLFLDELNRAASDVRGQLLTLINNHTVSDIHSESGERFLPNFLFTIAAINPSGADYEVGELDDAEKDRFKEVPVIANKRSLLKYLVKAFDEDIAKETDEEELLVLKGQKELVVTLLSHRDFKFDTLADKNKAKEQNQTKHLSPRSFETAINNCDGTKDDLLSVWGSNCGMSSKSMVERILRNYVDIKDKANQALEGETESEIFASDTPLSAKLKARLNKQQNN